MDGAEIEPAPIPSLSSGSVGSRFVSQKDIEAANATRDEQWKAAYARLTSPLRLLFHLKTPKLNRYVREGLVKNRLLVLKRRHTMVARFLRLVVHIIDTSVLKVDQTPHANATTHL